jgi:hypothetical protein
MSGRHYRSNRGKDRALPARDAHRMINRDRCRHRWENQIHSFGKQIDWCGKCGVLRIIHHHCNGKEKRVYKAPDNINTNVG